MLFVMQLTGNTVVGTCGHGVPHAPLLYFMFWVVIFTLGRPEMSLVPSFSVPFWSRWGEGGITTVKDPVMISPEFFSELNRICVVSTFPRVSLAEERGCSHHRQQKHGSIWTIRRNCTVTLIYSECYSQPGYTLITFILAQILLLGYV